MPFLIRPPPDSVEAENPGSTHTLLVPDESEWSMLRDLCQWGWRITRHDFGDDIFIDALKQTKKDTKRRRRHTHAIAGELLGYTEGPTLEDLWCEEGEKMHAKKAYEEQKKVLGRQLVEEHEPFTEKKHSQEAEKCVSGPVLSSAIATAQDVPLTNFSTWLRSVDRTWQMNGHLEYFDVTGEQPRLVTQGLDHICEAAIHEPARVRYHQTHNIPRQRPYGISVTRPRSVCEYFRRSRSVCESL
jgi:hypothetical protein